MPHYTFELRDGSSQIEDATGVNLPDRQQAVRYAHQVARELMRCREKQTRTWRLDVYEDEGERLFEIPFVRIDETLAHLSPSVRAMMEDLCDRVRSLMEARSAAAATVRESRALVARSRGRPYLATTSGRRTIRDA
jgi:hypothetical protein